MLPSSCSSHSKTTGNERVRAIFRAVLRFSRLHMLPPSDRMPVVAAKLPRRSAHPFAVVAISPFLLSALAPALAYSDRMHFLRHLLCGR